MARHAKGLPLSEYSTGRLARVHLLLSPFYEGPYIPFPTPLPSLRLTEHGSGIPFRPPRDVNRIKNPSMFPFSTEADQENDGIRRSRESSVPFPRRERHYFAVL